MFRYYTYRNNGDKVYIHKFSADGSLDSNDAVVAISYTSNPACAYTTEELNVAECTNLPSITLKLFNNEEIKKEEYVVSYKDVCGVKRWVRPNHTTGAVSVGNATKYASREEAIKAMALASELDYNRTCFNIEKL